FIEAIREGIAVSVQPKQGHSCEAPGPGDWRRCDNGSEYHASRPYLLRSLRVCQMSRKLAQPGSPRHKVGLVLTVDPHPLLDALAFTTTLPGPLSSLPSPAWLAALLKLDAPAPLASDDAVRGAVRDLLRHGGYKPTG